MKTIFVTIFEGVEAKNILRTDILPTLLKEKDLRLVLFTKNEAKKEYYAREFKDPRVVYEVVGSSKIRGLDSVFRTLKFLLINTESKDLQREIKLQNTRNYFSYYAMTALSRLLARPSVRKFVRILDFYLVRKDIYALYFDKYKPDLVFLAHLFDEPETHLLREAKRCGVASIGFINSWDKITAKGILRLLPDKAVVFNDTAKNEMIKFNDMKPEDIFVGGISQYDTYFPGQRSSREEFFKKIGCDPADKLIVYAPMGNAFSSSDWEMIDLLEALISKEKRFGRSKLLVRFQPNDFFEESELKKRPYLAFDYPGMRFASRRGVDWDMDFNDIAHLRDTLGHMALLVCYASSMSVDAAVFGKPVININFEIGNTKLASKFPTKFYRMTHYRNALRTGGIRLVGSKSELIEWMGNYLENPSRDKLNREKLVLEQCKFTDGKSGERIGKFILGRLYEN